MKIWLWVLIGIMALIIIALSIKIFTLQKSAREIENAFTDKLTVETNTLIDISSRDKYMRSLASQINTELVKLRSARHHFQQGDTELKNAVTNISHDLRTPLTAICGYLDLLDSEEKSEAAESYIGIIKDRTDMLKTLTDELFSYSVITDSEDKECLEEVAVNSVLEESIASFYAALSERGIEPTVDITETPVVRTLDRSALSRVFSNIIGNAVKYSDGDLDIVLRESGEIVFSNSASALTAVEVGKLFDRFYTVNAARKSTGLGLSIARTLILRMGGEISAGYENGRLSIVVVLPRE